MDKEKNTEEINIHQQLKEMQNQLMKLTNQKEDKKKIIIHLHINDVSIETLHLDELTYKLDKIDIKELSGMLNLGNAFSPKVLPKQQPTNSEKKEKKSKHEPSQREPGKEVSHDFAKVLINGKEVDYRIEERNL